MLAGSPETQRVYYERVLALAQEKRFAFVISFIHQDYDALWEKIKSTAPELFIAWRDCGLLDQTGHARPAYRVWKGYFDLPLVAATAGDAQARWFHVDAARGDDCQDGLKPETAWRSLARVNRAVLAPGDRVLFRRGQAWRGQLVPHNGNVGGVITYGAFGEGEKPIFLGSVAADRAEDWQPAGQGVWTTSSQTIPLSVDVGSIIFDHGASIGAKQWSEADLHHDGDFFYDARSRLVKLRLNGNPATHSRSIELALRRHIIDQSGRGYVTYENLDLRYGAAHGIGGSSTHHITVRGCDISFIGGGHQMTRPDGKPVRFGNGIEFWSDAHDCLVEDCRLWEILRCRSNQPGRRDQCAGKHHLSPQRHLEQRVLF